MKKSVACCIAIKPRLIGFHRRNFYDVLLWRIIAINIHQSKVVAVQVHWVARHQSVVNNQPQVFVLLHQYFIGLQYHLVIYATHIPFHIARLFNI